LPTIKDKLQNIHTEINTSYDNIKAYVNTVQNNKDNIKEAEKTLVKARKSKRTVNENVNYSQLLLYLAEESNKSINEEIEKYSIFKRFYYIRNNEDDIIMHIYLKNNKYVAVFTFVS
jgi:septal ring factor EnvC (AmiA/AmiB activator)